MKAAQPAATGLSFQVRIFMCPLDGKFGYL
jgi:hypothetical protein